MLIRRAAVYLLILAGFAAAQSAEAQAVRILPLGDSWTQGYGHHVGYRYDLWFSLTDAGYDVDFVGPRTVTADGPDLSLYPMYQTAFDQDHAGYSGYRTDQLAEISLGHYQPDIVLLWAGGNDIDMQGAAGVVNARIALRKIIEGLRAQAPEVTVLLGRVHDYIGRGREFIAELNDVIETTAAEMDRPESPVILVEHSAGFDLDSMMQSDGMHHNREGEAWVAQNWFEVLEQILPEAGKPEIDATYSGAWFNPQTPGQGQLIEAEPGDKFMFLAWFTFQPGDSSNGEEQHWFTAQGPFAGNEANLTLYQTVGGRFDEPQTVTTDAVGTALLTFSDCNAARLDYVIDHWNLAGSIPIERVIPGSDSHCAQTSGQRTAAVTINAGMDGAWFQPETSGQGFLIDVEPELDGGNFVFVAWFTFGDATQSGQRWLTAQGSFEGPDADLILYETIGGAFDDSMPVTTEPAGTMKIRFNDCDNATVSYALSDTGVEGEIDISRVLPKGAAACEGFAEPD